MYSRPKFVKLVGSTKSEIRYYEQRGILLPDYVDPENSRRYYTDESVNTFRQIQDLQAAGYTLDEIQHHLDGSDGLSDADFYAEREKALRKQLEILERMRKERVVEKVKEKKCYSKPFAEKVITRDF